MLRRLGWWNLIKQTHQQSHRRRVKFLALIAVVGFIVSALAHLITFTGVDCSGFTAIIFPLVIVLFVVWIPTVYASKNFKSEKDKDFWKVALARFPKWFGK